MDNPSSYYFKNLSPNMGQEFERLKYQAELSWDKEARNLSWFGLQDGMSIVELGSGGGYISEKLLNLCPHSLVTIVDISPVMLERSKTYLQSQDKTHQRVTFIEASVTDTGLPDNHFDLAYGRLIFQHLPDPVAAAREIFRILKPGGKIVITDIDDQLCWLSEPSISEVYFLLNKVSDIQGKLGGNRFIGRQLWSILKNTGFINLDLETILSHSGQIDLEEMLIQFDGFVRYATPELTTEEIEIIEKARHKLVTDSNRFLAFLWFMACGEKPI